MCFSHIHQRLLKKRHSKIGQINESEKPRKNKELVADVHTSSCYERNSKDISTENLKEYQ